MSNDDIIGPSQHFLKFSYHQLSDMWHGVQDIVTVTAVDCIDLDVRIEHFHIPALADQILEHRDHWTLAKIVGGLLTVNEKARVTTRYLIRNRGPGERTVIVEHAIRAGWKLFAPEKPMETSRDMYRFEVVAKSNETVTLEVLEDTPTATNTNLTSISEEALRFYVAAAETGPAVKQDRKSVV